MLGHFVVRSKTLSRVQLFHTSRIRRQLGCYEAIDTSWEWLKDPKNPRLQRFLKLERNYLANQISKPKFRKIERTLNFEFRNRLLRQDASIPECIGKYEYFTRQERGENFPVYYRRLRSGDADEEIVLNQNVEMSLNHDFHLVATMKLSADATQVLLVMENESEESQVMLKNVKLNTLQILTNLTNVKNVEWSSASPPNESFYYTQKDTDGRPFAVYRYNLATHTQELIYEEQHKAFFVDVSQTKDMRFILINCNSKNASEIYALESHDLNAKPQVFRKRESGTLYFVDHAAEQFFIITNANGAQNYQIATCKWHATTKWHVIIPEQKDVKIEDVDVYDQYLVLYERVKSIPQIRVYSYENLSFHYIPIPEIYEIGRIFPGINRECHSNLVRFQVTTPLIPEIVFDYDMKDRQLHVLKEKNVIDSSHDTKFGCFRYFVPSKNVQIPLTLIHDRNLTLNGKNPTLLIGYGAYGTNLEAEFELEYLSLLERGWIIALAHVRGGGECGLPWYDAGKGLLKRQSFEDYLACTHYLFDAQYTNPKLLAGKGVSAGGLIMGVVANEAPQLYQALIMKVPFVDIFATMLDASLPLTIHEYDEWGDPNQLNVREYIRSYAPCENVVEHQVYPAMFITGSLNDSRVQFWEPAKWMYMMRKVQSLLSKDQKRLMLLKMSTDQGHFGGSGRLEQLEESAMEIAFLYQAMGLEFPKK
ncbi:oligopeptidase b [Plasmopara halstedii]|uniref:Prolyl endopeptidase n=1 Tax=Plasmopara halstedii TaxID=4781 RepID=A0A0N7L756_PLAHL|nr:oligopeptidase b [Plasmopara halstedii]CEG46139.1 oligopeptidase b [Plasmopara halstedii]|eukprot:XP_024582508.1 oligopeptidase b [Plasmopara halstedii]